MSTYRVSEMRELVARALAPEYEIVREIGRGGMAVVYQARDTALGRDVALKVLPPQGGRDPELAERFLQEARTAAGLDHPQIVPIHQVGQRDGLVFFTMKYVAGASLRSVLKERGALGYAEASRILRGCAEALAYAHRAGVVHRDVKPANILLDGDGRLFVTDFGIAKAIAEDTPVTRSGGVIGTPHYLAPELCRGGRASARSDQYSLGVVGYEMLAGRLPFEGDTLDALVAQRLYGSARALRDLRPDLPAVLEIAVERAMRRDPAGRFASLLEMAELLGAEVKPGSTSVGIAGAEADRVEDRPTVQLSAGVVEAGRGRRNARPLTVAAASAAALTLVSLSVGGGERLDAGPAGVEADLRVSRSQPVMLPVLHVAGPEASASFEPPRAAPRERAAGPASGPTAKEVESPVRTEGAVAEIGPSADHLEAVGRHLAEGRLWTELGRYHDAFEQLERGLSLVKESAGLYGRSPAINSLELNLKRALEEARVACISAGQSRCSAVTN